MTRVRQCSHVARDVLPLHSTLRWQTAEPNPSDYEWNEEVRLCAFCSGKLRGWMSSDQGIEMEKPR